MPCYLNKIMKNKLSFFIKKICLITILILLVFLIIFSVNYEKKNIKLFAIEKTDINSDSQVNIIKSAKIENREVVLEDEEKKELDIQSDKTDTEKILEDGKNENYYEIELNSDNCEYSINNQTNTINIDKCNASVDCIIIPSKIDEKNIKEINAKCFSNCNNLETIKISKEISEPVKEISEFEVNEELEEKDYIVYTTTREYGEAYKGYLELSEEDKNKLEIIPPKYEIPLEINNLNNIKTLKTIGEINENAAYDLRDDIYVKVENQNPYGICYAYASFNAAETFWALNNKETLDFSEVHAAMLTTGDGGQLFEQDTLYYADKIGPVYEEEYPIYGIRSMTFPNAVNIENCLKTNKPSTYKNAQSQAKTKKPVKYITTTKTFPTITQSMKKDSYYDATIEYTRNEIKEHIKTYGALAAVINSNGMKEYNGKVVVNDQSGSTVDHGVTIIGWDDNFDVSNFPASYRPTKKGAYLVLNSWGPDWGENGCFWVSYEDKWIEYQLVGVTSMTETSENLKVSPMIVTDQETGEVLDNGNIEDGTKIEIKLEATVTTPIAGEEIKLKLRDSSTDYTSFMTITGTELVNNKANIDILIDTEEIEGDQYVLEINYGTETVSKMIETPTEFSYAKNADGTISIIAYTGKDKEIVIPTEYDGYKVTRIATNAFISSGVEKVTIEKGITTIDKYAFRSCENLTEITLPRTLESIGDGAFISCSNLKQLIIPRSVTTLGSGIVQYCTNLKGIVIFKETTTIGGSMFYQMPNAVIYCESGSTSANYASTKGYKYSIITTSYNISYNKNNDTESITNMPTTQNKLKYDTISISSDIPVRNGFEFAGWATTSTATEAEYQPGDDYSKDEDIELYAVWKSPNKNITYTIEYYKDDIRQDDDINIVENIVSKEESTVELDKTKINKENKYLGYAFEKTDPEVLPDTVVDGEIIKVYYKVQNYEINYNLDGGSLKEGNNPETYTVNDSVSLVNPEKEGYTFIGWTGSNGDSPELSVTISEGTTGNKEYTANYIINIYKLTYKVDEEQYGDIEYYVYDQSIEPIEEPTKVGYKFSGWSEIPEKMPANDVIVTGTFTIDESQTKELSYKVEYYKDGIKQNDDTETETVTVHVLASDEIDVNEEKINLVDKYEYYILDSTLTQIPEKVSNGDIIKVYYNRKDAKINVEYRDFVSGEEISEKVTKVAKVFDIYDITENKKEIEGYTFIEGPENLIGEYTEEEQTKVYRYAKNSKVTVNYIEKNTEETITESTIIEGYETKDYETEEKNIENYVLCENTNNTSGKMGKEDIVVNYYYIHVSEGVIEKHIDVMTDKILDTKVYEGNEGDNYKTEPKEFEGYKLVEERLPENSEGTMTKNAITVEYFYIRNTSVKVQYVDKISNEILLEDIIEGLENDTYKTDEKEFEGYELVEIPENAEGTMIVTKDEDQNVITEITVIYYYKKISEGITEKHIDAITNTVLDEKIYSGLEGDSYKTEPKEFEGYDLVEERMPSNTEGLMREEKIEVNYYYIRKTTVVVEYIDVMTNEKIQEDVIINNHEGDTYKVEPEEIETYILVEEQLPENAEGTIIVTKDEDDRFITETVIKYYYIKKSSVTVEYIEKETGNKIYEDTIIEGKEGQEYKVDPKNIEGYNLLNVSENAEGTMTRENIVVKVYYEKKLCSEEYIIKDEEIKKIIVGTTISDLKEKLSSKEDYVITDKDGNPVSEEDVIKTGMKLKLEDGKEYELVVRGDLNCDGKVTLTDLSKLILHYNGNRGFILSGSPCEAADMNFDDKITLTDISQMVVFYNSI